MCVCLSVCPSVSLRFCRSVVSSQSKSINCMCTGVFACTNQSLFRLFVSAKGLSDAWVYIYRLILDNCEYCYDGFVVVFMRFLCAVGLQFPVKGRIQYRVFYFVRLLCVSQGGGGMAFPPSFPFGSNLWRYLMMWRWLD